MAELAPVIRQRFFDANGEPLAGGKLYSYEAGTSTPKATFTTRAGTVANANPVVLDANGEADVWLGSGFYKMILHDANDVVQWTKDQVSIAAEAVLASAFWRDVIYITSADSPYSPDQDQNGCLISVDATSGAVVVNLPEISSLVLPYNLGVKLTNASNSLTVNRTGSDTIDGASSKVMDTANAGAQLIADIDKSPDQWSSLDLGTVADGAITPAKFSAAGLAYAKNAVYRSVTSTDNVLTTDETMKLSGASFTSTLPTAVGVAGKRYKFVHAGTSLSQVYALATTSAQTIGGVASGAYKLCTNGEVLEIESDDANWIIVNHFAKTTWIDGGVVPVGATSVAPTKASTKTLDRMFWMRDGKNVHIRYEYSQPNATSAASGTGDYKFGFPSGIEIDTTVMTMNTTVGASSKDLVPYIGLASAADVGTNNGQGTVVPYDKDWVRLYVSPTSSTVNTVAISSTVFPFSVGDMTFSAEFTVPVVGWQP